MKKNAFIFLLLLAALILPTLVDAQPVFDDEVNDVPIDGGLSLLVAAGIGYAAKKINNKQKSTNQI